MFDPAGSQIVAPLLSEIAGSQLLVWNSHNMRTGSPSPSNHSSRAPRLGSIQNQQTAPARATSAPRLMPHVHPSRALT